MATDAPAAPTTPSTPRAARADKPAAPAEPIIVMAKMDGTYPRPGDTYPVYRKAGETFVLNDPADFSATWMKKLAPGEAAQLDPEPTVPQTTGRHKVLFTHAPLP